jgi:hypothetical protein
VRRRHAALPHRQGRADHGPGVPTRECRMQRWSICLAVSAHCTGISSSKGLPHNCDVCQCCGGNVQHSDVSPSPHAANVHGQRTRGLRWTDMQMALTICALFLRRSSTTRKWASKTSATTPFWPMPAARTWTTFVQRPSQVPSRQPGTHWLLVDHLHDRPCLDFREISCQGYARSGIVAACTPCCLPYWCVPRVRRPRPHQQVFARAHPGAHAGVQSGAAAPHTVRLMFTTASRPI